MPTKPWSRTEVQKLSGAEVQKLLEQHPSKRGFNTDEELKDLLGLEVGVLRDLVRVGFVTPLKTKKPGRGWLRVWEYYDVFRLAALTAVAKHLHLSYLGAATLLCNIRQSEWRRLFLTMVRIYSIGLMTFTGDKSMSWLQLRRRGTTDLRAEDTFLELLDGIFLVIKPGPSEQVDRGHPDLPSMLRVLGVVETVRGREIPPPRQPKREIERKLVRLIEDGQYVAETRVTVNLTLVIREFASEAFPSVVPFRNAISNALSSG